MADSGWEVVVGPPAPCDGRPGRTRRGAPPSWLDCRLHSVEGLAGPALVIDAVERPDPLPTGGRLPVLRQCLPPAQRGGTDGYGGEVTNHEEDPRA
jgi:hypothetical protein